MVWYILLYATDVVSCQFVLMCFLIQMGRMNRGGLYANVRIYFALYLMLFSVLCLLNLFYDLEVSKPTHTQIVYLVTSRLTLLAMTITAYIAYQRIK